jgi:hypothetical protein
MRVNDIYTETLHEVTGLSPNIPSSRRHSNWRVPSHFSPVLDLLDKRCNKRDGHGKKHRCVNGVGMLWREVEESKHAWIEECAGGKSQCG